MTKQDGGPAFPVHECHTILRDDRYRDEWYAVGGMSLRDYFAGQTLAGVMANLSQMDKDVRRDVDRFARDCYSMADAMLKARQA